jgi:signal transduction histidine kinase/DNA-binding response OmpR family regulator/serine phosphatase RsbU (regulator of sigma subunit)
MRVLSGGSSVSAFTQLTVPRCSATGAPGDGAFTGSSPTAWRSRGWCGPPLAHTIPTMATHRAPAEDRGLAGFDGETGRLLARTDWAATPLGPPAQWPQPLRTAVSLCMASRFPMLIAWGRELVQIYNDAYIPIYGSKHPRSFGELFAETWSEIYDVIGPMAHGVLDTGQATWSDDALLLIDRLGFQEDTYFTFSYSPIFDATGSVGGMLSTAIETTERVLDARRMRAIGDLASSAADVRSFDGAARAGLAALGRHPEDLPFALVYAPVPGGAEARLVAATGVLPDGPIAPERQDFGAAEPWPLARVLERREAVDVDLAGVEVPGAPVPVRRARLLPLGRADGGAAAVLVAGLSPRRRFDAAYSRFAALVADNLATALDAGRAREEERDRAEALAALDAAKTDFFANVSHEFRTPLTLLLAPIEDALADEQLAPAQRERLDLVRRNALRLQRLVDALLDFSRLGAGRLEPTFRPTDLGEATAEIASSFRSAIEAAGLRLEVDAPALGGVWVDRDAWERVVLNLLSNALKHTFEGAISVRVRRADGSAEVTVADTGVGIPPEERSELFKRFHRVRGARSRTNEGAGIGLALVAEMVRLHRGEIVVDSTPGAGSAFTVRLPLGHGHLPADRLEETPAAPVTGIARAFVEEAERWSPDADARAAGPAAGARLLVADDNADVRAYLARLLGQHYAVEAVSDGQAALEAARREPPDLVLADVMMPRLDGFGLLRALRTDPGTQRVPVVLVSARAGEEASVEGLEAGADDYLVKPFSSTELLARVRANLDMAALREEAGRRAERHARRLSELADASVRVAACRAPSDVAAVVAHEARAIVSAGSVVVEDGEASAPAAEGEVVVLLGAGTSARRLRAAPAAGAVFSVEDEALLRQLGLVAAATLETAQLLEREHQTVETLQRSLLPALPDGPEPFEIAGLYLPATAGDRVGGDWYDVIALPDGRLGVVVGDVVGHGLGAASEMGILRSATRAYAVEHPGAAEPVARLSAFVGRFGEGFCSTMAYVVLDPADASLRYAIAGHVPLLLIAADGTTRLLEDPHGSPLGVRGRPAAEGRAELRPGDTLVLFTDGLVERRGESIDVGLDTLRSRSFAGLPVAALLDRLADGQTGHDDDVAVLAVRAVAPGAGQLELDLPSEPASLARARAALRSWLAQIGADPRAATDVVLAAAEALANGVEHAGAAGGRLRLHARRTADRLVVTVQDDGHWTEPVVRDGRGKGLRIMRALMDTVSIVPGPDGTRVELTRRLPPAT